MKIQELRIGNLINQHGQITKVYHLDIGGKSFYIINDMPIHKETFRHRDTHELIYSPVPLTEEWLIKFGFQELNMFWRIPVEDGVFFEVGYITDDKNFQFESPLSMGDEINLEYVHQLQNLYYALTGKELVLGEA